MSISIQNPVNTTPASSLDVKVISGGPGVPLPQSGALCRCNGDVLPPAGYTFDGIYFRMARGTTTYTPDQVVASPDVVLSKAQLYGSNPTTVRANWNLSGDTRLMADCAAPPNERPNRLYAVSRSFQFNPSNPTNPYLEAKESADSPFKGRQVTSCVTLAAGVAAAPSALESIEPIPTVTAAASVLPGPLNGVDVGPDNADDGWILYGGLSVNNFFFGNRLCRHGQPLRARILAVAAARVDWSIDLPLGPRRAVRRPSGDGTIEPFRPSPWRFPNSPTYAITLYQPGNGGPEQVLGSMNRGQPDILQFDNQQDILVQVNYLSFMQSTACGSFDLWVKVID